MHSVSESPDSAATAATQGLLRPVARVTGVRTGGIAGRIRIRPLLAGGRHATAPDRDLLLQATAWGSRSPTGELVAQGLLPAAQYAQWLGAHGLVSAEPNSPIGLAPKLSPSPGGGKSGTPG